MVEEWERHYAQVNEMKEKSIDSTFEKKTQEKGWGRVIYQSQTESGSRAWENAEEKCSILIGLLQPNHNTVTAVCEQI